MVSVPDRAGYSGGCPEEEVRVELFVVGAGYVGLTTAVGFVQLGHRVTVHDIDAGRIESLEAGRVPIFEPGLDDALRQAVAANRVSFTTDPSPGAAVELAVVCVPTPIGRDGLLDTSVVEAVVGRLVRQLPADRTIVVRSTLPLGGPDRLQRTSGDGERASIVVNPEFMAEGKALADFTAPSRVAIGYLTAADREAAVRLADLYAPLGAPLILADARSVVLVKLASNVFLGLKIAFANELARLCDATGADVTVVADGLGLDPRIGRAFLNSGPGFGGSCLPEQAAAIAVETARCEVEAPLLSAIATSNTTHQQALVSMVERLLPRGLRQTKIALLGLAFKANTDDVRHSPALTVARGLRARGARVVGYDPIANSTAKGADPELETASSAAEAINGSDAVVIATEWPEFASLDWAAVGATMRGDLVYDTRRTVPPDAVTAAGLRYVGLGRAGVPATPR
jgi:UDPglucose 6-dehydrogenase